MNLGLNFFALCLFFIALVQCNFFICFITFIIFKKLSLNYYLNIFLGEDECAGVTCLYNAMCIPEPKQCITTPCPQYRCGNNSLQLLNLNQFIIDLKKKMKLECPQVKCSSSLAEVCGTDGNTYDNDCILQKAICRTQGRIQLEHEGPCASKGILISFLSQISTFKTMMNNFFFFLVYRTLR